MKLRLLVAIAIATLAAAGCGSSEEVDTSPATTETTAAPTTTTVTTETTAAPTTTTAPPFSSDDALAVADAYFEAYNAGDTDAVLGLFEADAIFLDNFGPLTLADWEQRLIWNAAQGTTLSPAECRLAVGPPDAITVTCPHENLDALVQAVGGPPVPISLKLTVTPDGIRTWTFFFGQPDFNTVGVPFTRWMAQNHPEDLVRVGFGNWSSVEEAEQNGLLTAQYANGWATYLDANGCTYRDGC